MIRLWHRLRTWVHQSNLRDLQDQRRHTQRRIAQLEAGILVVPYRAYELKQERRHLAGLNYCIRKAEQAATRAAMLARI